VELAKVLNNEFSAQFYGIPETKEHIKDCITVVIGYSLIHFLMDSKGYSAEAFSAGGISNLNIDADAANVEIPGNELKQANRRLARCWSVSRPASPTLQCPITHPLGEGKHSRFILSNTLIRIMYRTRLLL
jgi:hypothetical protein